MKVEIWSDVVCPFCYIGKRKFEMALQSFQNRDAVTIEWKSFQLDPSAEPAPGKNQAEILAVKKGISLAQAQGMVNHVTAIAASVGLQYQMDRAIVANTFLAHRFLHLAKAHGKQNEAEERLFQAYFIEGKDIGDTGTLHLLGIEIGLSPQALTEFFSSDAFSVDVRNDQLAAQQIGVSGVPFFVFNEKYAVSGAQDPEVFAEVLQKVWQEENLVLAEGNSCTTSGACM